MPVFVNMSTTFSLYGSLLVLSKYLTPKHYFPNVSAELQYLIVQHNMTIKFRSLSKSSVRPHNTCPQRGSLEPINPEMLIEYPKHLCQMHLCHLCLRIQKKLSSAHVNDTYLTKKWGLHIECMLLAYECNNRIFVHSMIVCKLQKKRCLPAANKSIIMHYCKAMKP